MNQYKNKKGSTYTILKNFWKGADPKVLDFKIVYMKIHRRSGLLISKIALEKLFRYLINCAGVTRQNRFL